MTEYRCIHLLLMLAGLTASHARVANAEQTNGKRYNVGVFCRRRRVLLPVRVKRNGEVR